MVRGGFQEECTGGVKYRPQRCWPGRKRIWGAGGGRLQRRRRRKPARRPSPAEPTPALPFSGGPRLRPFGVRLPVSGNGFLSPASGISLQSRRSLLPCAPCPTLPRSAAQQCVEQNSEGKDLFPTILRPRPRATCRKSRPCTFLVGALYHFGACASQCAVTQQPRLGLAGLGPWRAGRTPPHCRSPTSPSPLRMTDNVGVSTLQPFEPHLSSMRLCLGSFVLIHSFSLLPNPHL